MRRSRRYAPSSERVGPVTYRPQITIDKDVPLKPWKLRIDAFWVRHFDQMNVGDSFVIKTADAARRCISSAWTYKQRPGNENKCFTTRRVDTVGWRCWRIQ